MRGNNSKLPGMVDNVVGDNEISNMFLNKFSSIFTSVGYRSEDIDEIKNKVMNRMYVKQNVECDGDGSHVQNVIDDNIVTNTLMSDGDIEDALKDLSSGKSDGDIGIY